MIAYSQKVENMACVAQEVHHGAAPIPEEGKWVKSKNVQDISGLTHGVGWCAPQQGACKLTLNVKDGIIQEALVETLGCSGMTHSAAMAAEILPGLTILEADRLNAFDQAVNIKAGSFCDLFTLFDGRDAVFLQHSKNLGLSSFIGFK